MYFMKVQWERSTRSANQQSENVRDQLTEFCTDVLHMDLFRPVGSYLHTMS